MKNALLAILLLVFAGVVTAQTLRHFERQAEGLRENIVLDWADLVEEAEVQREIFNTITPPGYSWVQPFSGDVTPFEALNFSDGFRSRLQGGSSNTVAVYPLLLALDPHTRETIAYNAEGGEVARLALPDVAADWEEDADPARIILSVDLVEDDDVDLFAYTAQRIAESQRAALSLEQPPARSPTPATGLRFAGVEFSANGIPTFRLTSAEEEEEVEIFRYTLAETSVASSFSGFNNAWEYATNLTLTNNEVVWTDETLPATNSIAFYAAAFVRYTDADTLSDGMELFVHHTDPANPDTDSDGIPDGVEITWGLDPLNPADGAQDLDGDGLTNAEEYALGKDPTTPDEVTLVLFNTNPSLWWWYHPSSSGMQTLAINDTPNIQWVTLTNLRAKANTVTRHTDGFREFTSSDFPLSGSSKWYLECENFAETEGVYYDISPFTGDTYLDVENTRSYCHKTYNPYALSPEDWLSPTNHICEGHSFYYYHTEHFWLTGELSYWFTRLRTFEYDVPMTNGVQERWEEQHYWHGNAHPETNIQFNVMRGRTCDFPSSGVWDPPVISRSECYFFLPDKSRRNLPGYLVRYIRLFNEYTDEMLMDVVQQTLQNMALINPLNWGQHGVKIQLKEGGVNTLRVDEYYAESIYLPLRSYPSLAPSITLKDLDYQWTFPSETGTIYKLLWVEAFQPQDGRAYTEFTPRSEVHNGTGAGIETGIYHIPPPEESGRTEIFSLGVSLESDLAINSPMLFGDKMPIPPGAGEWLTPEDAAKADQKKIATSLTIPFDRASTPEGDVVDFDVTLRVVPDIFPNVTWELISGPLDSGTLLNVDTAVATFRNPTKGGVYTFKTTIPGLPDIYSQLWLPVSGPDISANFQDEINFLLDWGAQYQTNLHRQVMDRLGWVPFSQVGYDLVKQPLVAFDLRQIAPNFDYDLISPSLLSSIFGFSHEEPGVGANKPAGDSARLVLSGVNRPYVIDFAKRNNIGYAMCAKAMGLGDDSIRNAPNWALRFRMEAGTRDDTCAIASYNAGIALAEETPLTTVMAQYGRAMQPASMRISKEWPDPTPAIGSYIQLKPITRTYLLLMLEEQD